LRLGRFMTTVGAARGVDHVLRCARMRISAHPRWLSIVEAQTPHASWNFLEMVDVGTTASTLAMPATRGR
jgi:hypothetical protein